MTDQELLVQWVEQGDPEAFQEVVTRHARMVYGTCRRILQNSTEAEDITQECFESLVKAGKRPGGYLGAWLHRVATNLALRRLRAESRRKKRETVYSVDNPEDDSTEWNALYADVDAVINELPERFRLPLVMHFLEGKTHEEIAAALGVARTTITYRVGQGLERVKASLRKRGISLTAAALTALGVSASSHALPPALSASLGRLAIASVEVVAGASTGAGVLAAFTGWKAVVGCLALLTIAASVYEIRPYVHELSQQISEARQTRPSRGQTAIGNARQAANAHHGSNPTRPQPAPQQGGLALRGTIAVEGSGTPLRAVNLTFKPDNGGEEAHAETDASGHFTLEGIQPGNYHVTLDDEAFQLKNAPVAVSVTPQSAAAGLQLVAEAGGSIAGRIFDGATGKGLSKAGLYIAPIKPNQTEVSVDLERKILTDNTGHYALDGLRPGMYRVFMESAIDVRDDADTVLYRLTIRPMDSSKDVVVASGAPDPVVDFPINLGVTLAGKVFDSHGMPAKGASLEAITENGPQWAQSGQDGSFTIYGLQPSDHSEVFARLGDDASEVMQSLAIPQDGLKVALRPAGTIRGILVDREERPIASATLSAIPRDVSGICHADATTEKDGTFVIRGLVGASYDLTLSNYRGRQIFGCPPLATVDVKWGAAHEDVKVVYSPAEKKPDTAVTGNATVSGRVTDASGQGLPGAVVSAQIYDNTMGKQVGTPGHTDADGRFEITGLADGTYEIGASHPRFSRAYAQAQTGARNVSLSLPPCAIIVGQVTGSDTGQPVTQFDLSVAGIHPIRITDPDGKFKCDDVDTTGDVHVNVKAQGYAEWDERMKFQSGETSRDLHVVLEKTSPIAGRVVNAEGAPVEGASIIVTKGHMPVRGVGDGDIAARSDKNGEFQLSNIEADTGFVVARHRDYADGAAKYDIGTTSVQIVLSYAGAIEGRLTSAGAPVAGAQVMAGRIFRRRDFPFVANAVTGNNGKFTLKKLPPGNMDLMAGTQPPANDPLAGRSVQRQVEIPSGQTLAVELELPELTAGLEGHMLTPTGPLTDGMVLFKYMKDDVESPFTTKVEADGSYKFEAVPAGPGTIQVRIFAESASRDVSVPVETVAGEVTRKDIEISDSGAIMLTVSGRPAINNSFLNIVVFPSDAASPPDAASPYEPGNGALASAMLSLEQDAVRFSMMPPGEYTISGALENSETGHILATATTTVHLDEGKEAAAELALAPPSE